MNIEKKIIGATLAKLMREEQDKRGLNLAEMAEMLGMSKPYLTALLSGDRPLNKLSDNYLETIALFLSLPKAQVYNFAEILLPEDYVHRETIEDCLADLYKRMSSDTSWMQLVPSSTEWEAMPIKTKLFIGHLYENLTHAKIIKGITAYRFSD